MFQNLSWSNVRLFSVDGLLLLMLQNLSWSNICLFSVDGLLLLMLQNLSGSSVCVQCWQAAVAEDASLLQCLWCPAGGSSCSAFCPSAQAGLLLPFCSGYDNKHRLRASASDRWRLLCDVQSHSESSFRHKDTADSAGLWDSSQLMDQLFPVLHSVQLWWETTTDLIYTQIQYKSIQCI